MTGPDQRWDDFEVVTLDPADAPGTGVRAVADGSVLLARVGDGLRAYRNACPHRDSALETGVIRDGVLTCPAHLWRFRLDDGYCLNAHQRLEPLGCELLDGRLVVTRRAPATASLREQLLAHARDWDTQGRDRASAWGGAATPDERPERAS